MKEVNLQQVLAVPFSRLKERVKEKGPLADKDGNVNLFFPLFYGGLDIPFSYFHRCTTPYDLCKLLKEDIQHFTENGRHTKLSFDIFAIQMSQETNKIQQVIERVNRELQA